MTPCDRCSDPGRLKTVYHVGDCPKAPLFEILPIIGVDFAYADYRDQLQTMMLQQFMRPNLFPAVPK